MITLANFINGRHQPAQAGAYLPNENPATGAVYSQLPASTAVDVNAAVSAAQVALPAWRRLKPGARSAILLRIADLIRSHLPELARAESCDQGKPLWLAKSVDIPRAAANFEFFATAILHHENRSTSSEGGSLNYTLRSPVGVAGLISPWNLPLYLLTWKIAPALAMGNTVVCKPSELTPASAYYLSQLLQEAGLPAGVCNIVFGTGAEAGAALVAHPAVPLLSFTGSTATGERIIRGAAPHFKKVSLELGGKNPTIIYADADWDKLIPMVIRSSFLNQGEICLAGSRIYVEEGAYPNFLERFIPACQALQTGDPLSDKNFVGALVSAGHYSKVMAAIAQAKEWGGQILCGGKAPSNLPAANQGGYFCEPTVVTGLAADCPLMHEEVFGPFVTVTPFKDEASLLEMANSGPYGLSSSVWTSDLNRAHRLAAALEVGQVWVNTWMDRDLRTPFGGIKASGVGREGGLYSLEFYSEEKNVCIALT